MCGAPTAALAVSIDSGDSNAIGMAIAVWYCDMNEDASMNPNSEANPTDNIDAAEINKFARMAARWWDEEGECAALHRINPLRVGFIDERSPLAGRRVLDVGCGGGVLSEALALRGAEVTGIDVGAAQIEVAKLHALESGVQIDYRCITAEALADEVRGGARWDVVCCLEMLEHVPAPASVVRACAQLVAPGGAVYFSTINRNAKSFLFAIVGAEYVLGLVPRGTHQYEKLIRPSELRRWCAPVGLSVREAIGLHYNPMLQTYWLGEGLDVNYFLYCRADEDRRADER